MFHPILSNIFKIWEKKGILKNTIVKSQLANVPSFFFSNINGYQDIMFKSNMFFQRPIQILAVLTSPPGEAPGHRVSACQRRSGLSSRCQWRLELVAERVLLRIVNCFCIYIYMCYASVCICHVFAWCTHTWLRPCLHVIWICQDQAHCCQSPWTLQATCHGILRSDKPLNKTIKL